MRALVQRAFDARVSVAEGVLGEFHGAGLVVLVGVTHTDDVATANKLADKVHQLRIFSGPESEVSARDLDLPILVISPFTLYADTKKGRRPTWDAAAPGHISEPIVDEFVSALRATGARVETGKFGADMKVAFTNDGPITILLELGPSTQ